MDELKIYVARIYKTFSISWRCPACGETIPCFSHHEHPIEMPERSICGVFHPFHQWHCELLRGHDGDHQAGFNILETPVHWPPKQQDSGISGSNAKP